MRALICFLLCCGLSACATLPPPKPLHELLQDQHFQPPQEMPDPRQVLAMSDKMRQYLNTEIRPRLRSGREREGLLEALYDRRRLQLDYDSAYTRNAAQAFDERAGNCLSLVLMTASFARELGLGVRFNQVYVDEVWSRSAGLHMLTGHVNLSLGHVFARSNVMDPLGESLVVDFMPSESLAHQRRHVIDESMVVAMYLNNRSAEALKQGALDEAYWWARAAVLHEPRYLSAVNTLAVVYRRKGLAESAERSLRHVLAVEPANLQAMGNLSLVLSDQGQVLEAARLTEQLAKLQPYPPYKYFDLGRQAMSEGDFAKAKVLFTKEIDRSAFNHEFHFWLALANYGLHDMKEVYKHLTLAMDNSSTRLERDAYAAKLKGLRNAAPARP